jgi:heme/copper-type cytochrome/quinol oxidase subunit 2
MTSMDRRPGRYAFLCDNFCGDSHGQMNGLLVVQA